MAGSIKGIIVEIGGDTSGLQKALKQVNSATSSLSKELKGINTLLKFDPKNTELLSQKQTVLNKNIQETTNKLNQLKQAQKLADETIQNGGSISQENYRNLQREIINTENKLKQLKVEASNWTSVSKSLDNISSKMNEVGNAVSSAGNKFLALTATISAGVAYGVKYNSQMEKYESALKTLTGSAEEANKIMEQIKEDAKTTPFDVSGLTQANQLLISTGLNGDESRKTILALGNAISATGGGNEELSRMAVNLQQIKNTGKAAAIDIKQFAYAGIDIYGLLADYLGITKEEAADMTVTWEDLNGALIHASEEGGKYFGAMAEQSKTFNGAFSNAMDSFNQSLGTLTESLMPTLTKIIQKITEWMDKFNDLDKETKELILKITLLVAAIGPALTIIGKIITAGSSIINIFGKVSGFIGKITTGVGGLSKVLTSLSTPVGAVITSIVALLGVFIYLYKTNEQFRIKVQETWNQLVEFFQAKILPIILSLKDSIVSIINEVVTVIQEIWATLEPFILEMFNTVTDFWNSSGMEILGTLAMVLGALLKAQFWLYKNVVLPIVKYIIEVLKPAIGGLLGFVQGITSGIYSVISNAWNSIKNGLNGLINFLTGVFTGNWSKAWEGIKQIATTIFSGIVNGIKAPLNAVIDIINGFIKGINNVKVPDWVPGLGGKGINIPQIPKLAKGGIVDEATLALVGEGNASEAVIPLDRTLTKYMAEALKQAGGNNSIIVNFYPQKMTDAELDNAFNYINRKFGLQY